MKKALSLILALIFILSVVSCGRVKKNPKDAGKHTGESTEVIEPYKVGDIVMLGRYEQDNDLSNGPESIEWVILEKKGNKALVISKYALDSKAFNDSDVGTNWEDCSLRSWLNGTFLNTAFDSDDLAKIRTTKVSNEKHPNFDTDQGAEVKDKLFLLSVSEASTLFSNDEDRKCIPTEYAVANGCWTSDNDLKDGEHACWWNLRTMGNASNQVIGVRSGGKVHATGGAIISTDAGVRPAMWILIDRKPT